MPELLFTPVLPVSGDNVWAQAYRAGNLMTILVLQNTDEEKDIMLAHKGKEIIRSLEAEYFSLEVKTLQTITKACQEALKEHEDLVHTFLVGAVLDNVLYLFVYGNGKVLLCRKGTIGTLAASEGNHHTTLSGFVEPNDLLLFGSTEFFEVIPENKIIELLSVDQFTDFAESLLPMTYESGNPLACASLALVHHEDAREEAIEHGESEDEEEQNITTPEVTNFTNSNHETQVTDETSDDQETEEALETEPSLSRRQNQLHETHPSAHPKRILLTILVLLIAAFGISVFLFIKHSQEQKRQAFFQSHVVPAEKELTDGEALMSVNPLIAQQDITDAKKQLTDALAQFPQGTQEYTNTKSFLDKANNLSSQTITDNAQKVTDNIDPLLQTVSTKPDVMAATEDTKNIYVITSTGIDSISKTSKAETTIIKYSSSWTKVLAVQVYNSNVYALTDSGSILKFVAAGKSYAQSSYLGSTTLSGAESMTIDSDVWVGYKAGSIEKYTKGQKQSFSITGLTQPLSGIDFLITTIDGSRLYAVDKTNGALAIFDKSGTYQRTLISPELKNATFVALASDESTFQFLSGGQVYQIKLQ